VEPHPSNGALDETDRKLIRALQEDGRASYAGLAEQVGLSPAAVRNRVTRLLDTGLVKVLVIVDPQEFGSHTSALLRLRCATTLEPAQALIDRLEEVNWAAVTSGRFDLTVEVVCTDTDHLVQVTELFRSVETIVEIEVIVLLRYLKLEQMPLRASV
jgi:Lrp/AsnC family transcriptional regulator for asnA, asnC and gidA